MSTQHNQYGNGSSSAASIITALTSRKDKALEVEADAAKNLLAVHTYEVISEAQISTNDAHVKHVERLTQNGKHATLVTDLNKRHNEFSEVLLSIAKKVASNL